MRRQPKSYTEPALRETGMVFLYNNNNSHNNNNMCIALRPLKAAFLLCDKDLLAFTGLDEEREAGHDLLEDLDLEFHTQRLQGLLDLLIDQARQFLVGE